jgi:hypothetical protein
LKFLSKKNAIFFDFLIFSTINLLIMELQSVTKEMEMTKVLKKIVKAILFKREPKLAQIQIPLIKL